VTPIAYVGRDDQIHVVRADGGGHAQLTMNLRANPLLLWGQPELPDTAYAWPSWRPDGGALLCFETPGEGEGPVGVHAVETDGVRQSELLRVGGRVPIYGAWHPSGRGVALLLQDTNRLVLGWVDLADTGRMRVLAEGAPLFFNWHPTEPRVIIHVGDASPDSSRLLIKDLDGARADERLPQRPGNYCVPVVVGDGPDSRIVQVDRSGAVNRLVSSDLSGGDVVELLEFDGLGAVIPVPGRRAVVFSTAPDGEGTPYRGATLFDLDTGDIQRVTDDDCLAFFWSEQQGALIFAQVVQQERCVTWNLARPGEPTERLARFWPSREMLFYLHFFDQFAHSHSLLSPGGERLVFCGRRVVEDTDSPWPTEEPESFNVLVLDLERDDPPQAIAEGSFACFSPRSALSHA